MAQPKTIYLDYAAATPLDAHVAKAMQPYFSERFYNPSATYLAAKAVQHDLMQARSRVAYWLGARDSEIVFTAGGSEANNLALHGVMSSYPGGNLVVSAIEHDSVLAPAKIYPHKLTRVTRDGRIDLKHLQRSIDDKTVLVSIMYANNEIGTIQPLKEITTLVKSIRTKRQKQGNTRPLYVHTDACQAAAYLDLHVNRLGVDLMTLNGGKIYGPKQSGALYIKTGTTITPQILGGGQERGLRSGTENVVGCIGLAAALDLVQGRRVEETKRLAKLQTTFTELLTSKLPNCTINGSLKHRLPNNVHVTLAGQDNERLMMQLDEQGIQCAVGSACSASNDEPSHVLMAIGLTEAEAQASLRFSFGHTTKAADIRRTVITLANSL